MPVSWEEKEQGEGKDGREAESDQERNEAGRWYIVGCMSVSF